MRERLSRDLAGLSTDFVLAEGLRAMQAASRMFLDENQSPRSGYGPPYEAQLHSTLGELRALFGIHITRIACAYDLEVDRHLEGILPPEPDWDLRQTPWISNVVMLLRSQSIFGSYR
jgi:hypothetical protein